VVPETVDVCQRKYFSLRRRCEQVQQSNEKLVNRLQHVKKLIRRYKKERRFLMGKLDEHGDPYRDVDVRPMWEESQVYLLPPPSGSSHGASSSVEPGASLLSPGGGPHASLSPASASLGALATASARARKPKQEKGQEARKPSSAFLNFYEKERVIVKEEYLKEHGEDITSQELCKILTLKWANMSAQEKQTFARLPPLDATVMSSPSLASPQTSIAVSAPQVDSIKEEPL